jgi:hypothetical protein
MTVRRSLLSALVAAARGGIRIWINVLVVVRPPRRRRRALPVEPTQLWGSGLHWRRDIEEQVREERSWFPRDGR